MSARFRKLNMELMERREMMAADITAVLQNGNLYINEAKGSVGRKFLIAGKGGLNLTA